MPTSIPRLRRPALLAVLVLLGAAACQRTTVPPASQPVTLTGEWQLSAAGGGITGRVDPVPAGQDTRLLLSPDSTYVQRRNGQQLEAGTYQLRRLRPAGQPDTLVQLRFRYTQPATSQVLTRMAYVSQLTASELHTTTGSGCPLIEHYARRAPLLCGTP